MPDAQPENAAFYSHGARLSAHYYPPRNVKGPAPGVVFCPGFTGTKVNTLYDLFVGPLTAAGYAVLVPDHRGWGESEGEPGAIYPLDQVEDLRAALTYLETREDVQRDRLGVFGVSFGGGNATCVTGVDSRVRAGVSISGVGEGRAWLRGMRREYEWRTFLHEVEDDRRLRARTGDGRAVDPTEEIMVASPERRALKGAGSAVRTPLACADAILDYRPADLAGKIAPRAMLWMCLSGDPVVPADHSRWMYDAASEPKKLVVLPGEAHYEGYARFQGEIMSNTLDWYARYLRGASDTQVDEAAPR